MTPHQTALARSRTYGLIAEILLDGWTPRAVEIVRTLPWGASLPAREDALAVRHQRVLGRCVPPYESVFRSHTGLLGGPVAGRVRQSYEKIGFFPKRTDIEPDHIGLQCAAISYLCAAESDAHRDGVPTHSLQRLQQEFLAEHMGQWAAQFNIAVQQQKPGELGEIAALLDELVHEHFVGERASPPAEDVLADPSHGLKDIVAYFLVPARCGVWLSVEDIQRIAERAELACGFGRRKQMLESLWFSAVDHGRVDELCSAFTERFAPWQSLEDARVEQAVATLDQLSKAASPALG